MNDMNSVDVEEEIEQLSIILKAMMHDPVINKKLVTILQMDSYPRHIVLSNWLEQLRRNSAKKDLLNAISCLFDDEVSEQVLTLVNDRKL